MIVLEAQDVQRVHTQRYPNVNPGSGSSASGGRLCITPVTPKAKRGVRGPLHIQDDGSVDFAMHPSSEAGLPDAHALGKLPSGQAPQQNRIRGLLPFILNFCEDYSFMEETSSYAPPSFLL